MDKFIIMGVQKNTADWKIVDWFKQHYNDSWGFAEWAKARDHLHRGGFIPVNMPGMIDEDIDLGNRLFISKIVREPVAVGILRITQNRDLFEFNLTSKEYDSIGEYIGNRLDDLNNGGHTSVTFGDKSVAFSMNNGPITFDYMLVEYNRYR